MFRTDLWKFSQRVGRAVVILLATAVMSVGCGKQFDVGDTEERSQEDENLIVVGVSQVGSESVWRTANTASIQEVFTRENGYLLIFDNARQKQENQIKAIRSFISQQVDYIVFSPIEEDGWDDVLHEAKNAKIPVILMDRMVQTQDKSLFTAWIGSNFEEEGENAGRWLADYLEEQERQEEIVNIVVLQGTEGSTSTIGRTDGFNKVASEHRNWNILEQTDGDFTTAKAREEMKRLLDTYEDIDVIVSQNDDMTFGVLETLKNAGIEAGADGDVIVISFDAVRSALEKVESGEINVDIECNPEQGPYIERVIQTLEEGGKAEKYSYVPEQIFTQDNLSRELIDERSY